MLIASRFTTLDALLESYRLQAETEGKSAKTIGIYTTAVTILRNFLEQNGLPSDVTKIGVQEFRRFILHLQGAEAYNDHPFKPPQQKQLTGHTINCYLRVIRAFWGWLVSEDIIENNPFGKIKVPKPPKKVILHFTGEQLRSLLAVIDEHSPIGFRDQTIILTLLDTGLRVSELTGLKLNDTNLNERSLRVRGKGGKERVVPIGATVQRAIARYINRYRPAPANQFAEYLFLTRAGEPLTANRIESIVETCAKKSGMAGVRCSPHTFRHTFAISYLRNGGDVFSLQRILGHSTLDMVRNYINLAQSDLQAAHLRCSPVDNMRLKASKTT